MILQRTGDNLGGRSASAIGQKNQRNRGSDRIVSGDERLIITVARAYAGDLLSLLEEEIADAQRLVENATRVAPQIYNDTLGAFAGQLGDGALGLIARALVELTAGWPILPSSMMA